MFKCEPRRIVRSWAGEGTGETIYQDDRGNTYRLVSEAEAHMIRQSTAGQVYRLNLRDGTVS